MTELTHFSNAINIWAAGLGMPAEGMLRLVLAGVVGGLVGLEREIRGRQAGFRTHLLVCLGSALAMVVSVSFAAHGWDHPTGFTITTDPARIAYGVMAGVGFMGAGAIVHDGTSVRGLTTAASIWCAAALGLASGFGLYVLALAAALLVLLSLWLLDYAEEALPRQQFRVLTVRRPWTPNAAQETADTIAAAGVRVHIVGFQRLPDLSLVDVRLRVTFKGRGHYDNVRRQLDAGPQCQLIASQED